MSMAFWRTEKFLAPARMSPLMCATVWRVPRYPFGIYPREILGNPRHEAAYRLMGHASTSQTHARCPPHPRSFEVQDPLYRDDHGLPDAFHLDHCEHATL